MRLLVNISLFFMGSMLASADIVSYLRFEEGSGFGAFDETGLMDGEVLGFTSVAPGGGDSGGTGWSTSVPSSTVPLTGDANNGSLHFGPGMVDLSNGNDLSLGTEFTIEMFFMPDAPGIGYPIYGFEPSSELRLNLSESGTSMYFNTEFQNYSPDPVLADDVSIGEWQHLAMVKEPGMYTIYINGVPITAEPLPIGTDGPYIFPGTGLTGDRTIGDGFSGWIDEFRISNEALLPSQFLIAPEPSTILLMVVGGLTLARRRLRMV